MTDKPRKLIIVSKPDEDRPLECGVCGTQFRKDQLGAYDRHMYRCANSETAAEMEQHSPRVRLPFFRPDFGDVEYAEWIARNRRALIEKRMKM